MPAMKGRNCMKTAVVGLGRKSRLGLSLDKLRLSGDKALAGLFLVHGGPLSASQKCSVKEKSRTTVVAGLAEQPRLTGPIVMNRFV